MKVLFLKDVAGVAEYGDTKDVSDGYAINYLLPGGLAVSATIQAVKEFKDKKAKTEKLAAQELKKVQDFAARLDGYELDIDSKVSSEGKFYGGIGAQKIAQELKSRGFEIKKSQIIVPGGSIKITGPHGVTVRFDHGIEAELIVNALALE